MRIEAATLLGLVLGAAGALALTGVASAAGGRRMERVGVWGAGLACLVGGVAALLALATGASVSLALPWSMPVGAFRVGLDPLTSFFLVPTFLLSGLAGIYAQGYFQGGLERHEGRFRLFFNALAGSMALVLVARDGVLFLVAWEAMALASFFLVVHVNDGAE